MLNSISAYGNWASIVGLALSLLTLIVTLFIESKVRKINRRFLFYKRIEDLKQGLENNASNISDYLEDYSSSKENILIELSSCRALVTSILEKLPKDKRKDFLRLKSKLKNIERRGLVDDKSENNGLTAIFKRNEFDKEDVWEMYRKINYMIKTITIIVADNKNF